MEHRPSSLNPNQTPTAQKMPPNPAAQLKVLQIVCAALAFYVLAQLYIGKTMVDGNAQNATGTERQLTPSLENPFAPVLGGVSVLMVIGAIAVVPLFLNARRKMLKPGEKLEIPHVFVPTIIRFALLEAISIFGIVVNMNSTDLNYAMIATGITLAGYIVFFPTEDRVRQLLK